MKVRIIIETMDVPKDEENAAAWLTELNVFAKGATEEQIERIKTGIHAVLSESTKLNISDVVGEWVVNK